MGVKINDDFTGGDTQRNVKGAPELDVLPAPTNPMGVAPNGCCARTHPRASRR